MYLSTSKYVFNIGFDIIIIIIIIIITDKDIVVRVFS